MKWALWLRDQATMCLTFAAPALQVILDAQNLEQVAAVHLDFHIPHGEPKQILTCRGPQMRHQLSSCVAEPPFWLLSNVLGT